MITVRVRDRDVYAIPLWPITTGSVGLPVAFEFDEAWDGLTRIAVFRGSDTDVEVALLIDTCVVPPEVLTVAGGNLYIGVYGRDAYGTTVIPTIWGKAGHIYDGTEPEDPDPADPTPEWSYQVQQAASQALRIAAKVREDLDSGVFDGEDGVSPTVAVTDITGGHRVTITDAEGDHSFDVMDGEDGAAGQDGTDGRDGQDGQDGVSPTVTITAITGGHRVTITDAEHPTGQSFDVMDGEDGEGGGGSGTDGYSPTVSITTIIGGHRVTITDVNGPHTYDVMDGTDGTNGQNGTNGQDGVSPAVSISTITGGHRVTITDKAHPNGQSFDVMDGAAGPQGPAYTLTTQDKASIVASVLDEMIDAETEGL